MARRITKNRTGNKSPRNHDYQAIYRRHSSRVLGVHQSAELLLTAGQEALELLSEEAPNLAAAGLYLRSDSSQTVKFVLLADDVILTEKLCPIGSQWTRCGIIWELDDLPVTLTARLAFGQELEFFGANIGVIDTHIFPFVDNWKAFQALQEAKGRPYPWSQFLTDLNASHLAPEAGYLQHDQPACCDVGLLSNDSGTITQGSEIELKYCSLCERLLPISSDVPGLLAFHKHTPLPNGSFRSWHQQECRACKKFRINNDLNDKRTSDQFHESSLIHRERSLFLREPQIHQQFKTRYNTGLKNYIWQKFGRQCFRCHSSLELGEARIDHTRPFAYLWPLDEHATLLCQTCNGEKSDTFPVDFYTPAQLLELAQITGLTLDQLRFKGVNPDALRDVIANIAWYGNQWSAKTFKNVNFKIREFHPSINLYDLYKQATGITYSKQEYEDVSDDQIEDVDEDEDDSLLVE